MKRVFKRVISGFISAAVLITSIPVPAMAHWDTDAGEKPERIVTSEKGTVQVEESWEEAYPYGAFLFDNSDAALTEGGDEITIPLYRLGGTNGRATAYVTYAPVVTWLNEETPAYKTAAGNGDVKIKTEDELPIARYQPVGKDPDPDASGVKINDDEYTGEEAQPGDRVLTIDEEAESYQWYIMADTRWHIVDGATDPEFVVGEDMLEGNDFRCVFKKDGKTLSSDTFRGKPYEKPEKEEVPEMPEDLDLKPDQTFTELDLDDEDPYSATLFAITFAEGEWKKEIKVSAPDNDEAQPLRFGTFTILENEGGAIFRDASTVTLQVADNDESEPYTIGFTEPDIRADRADGKATLTLKRTGVGQDVITLDWSTADGTAIAGRDYKSTSGTAVFFADVDEVTIEIPLLRKGEKSDEEPVFRVELGEIKGDSGGLCTITDEYAQISITDSGRKGPAEDFITFTTVLEDEEGAEDEMPVPGEQVIIPDEDLLKGDIAGLDDEDGFSRLTTYNYGEISFAGKHGGSYWEDKAYIAGKNNNDITGWKSGGQSGNGWKLTGKGDSETKLNIDHMPQMYKDFYGKFSFDAGWCSWYYFSLGHAYGWAELMPGIVKKPDAPSTRWDGLTRKMTYGSQSTISKSWDIDSNVSGIALHTSYKSHESADNVKSEITEGYLTRRTFDNNLNLRIHTSNDGEDKNGNVATAPKGGAALKENSGVYKSIKPEILIEDMNGGVNNSGRLYVGSKLRVTLKSTDSYKPYTGSDLSAAVYVTRKNGSRLPAGVVQAGKDGVYYVTMLWDGMTGNDITDTYTINIVMMRKQDIELNLLPSVQRDPDDETKIDTSKIGDAWDDFWRRGSDSITIGVSDATENAPHYNSKKISEIKIKRSGWKSGDKNPLKILGSYADIQYINFNRNSKDRIVFNKKAYKGNERINLKVEDLAFAKLSFAYYEESYLDKPSTMEASINRVELYLDGDGNEKIDGSYNEDTGYFVLDSQSKDKFVMYLEDNTSYDEVEFQPIDLGGGRFGQYFAKVYYTMTPRYLNPPKGADGKAQVLPALITSVTNEANKAGLTEEQNSYRYLISGKDKGGRRTSDDHIMNTAEATGINYVDVPLGGDHSPLVEVEEGVYEWNPKYVGNLIYPFSDPEPIQIEHSLAGDNIPLARISYGGNGKINTTDEGKANLNGYLGSMVADTTIALCVTEQKHTADQLHADPDTARTLQPESSALTGRSAAPNGAWNTKVGSADMGSDRFDTSKSGQSYPEFNTDLDMDLKSKTYSFQGLATVITGKNTLTISVSLPVASWMKDSGGGEFQKKTFPSTVTDPLGKNKDYIMGYASLIKNGNFDRILDELNKGNYKKGEGGTLKSKKQAVTINCSLAFTLKYDTRENAWYMQEFAFGAGVTYSFRYEVRLAVCPLLYVYVSTSIGVTVGTGGTVMHTAVEGNKPFISGDGKRLKKGAVLEVPTPYVNMNLKFNGKVYVEVLDNQNSKSASEGTNKGYLKSDGSKKIQVQFKDASEGMTFDENKTTKYVRIVALEDTTVTYVNNIEEVRSEVVWSGVSIAPKFNMEAGVGFGVEGLKVEAFIRLQLSANFVFGRPKQEGGMNAFKVASVNFTLSLAIRAVCLMFSFEMDAVGIKVTYDGDTDTWKKSYITWGKDNEFDSILDMDPGGGSGSILQMPKDVSRTQTIYSGQTEELSSLDAYTGSDPNVPFMLSGYNSSAEAIRLADGLDLGYDYKVVTTNGQNYVIYTIGRPGAGRMDTSMLAVSRLVTTVEGHGAKKGEEVSSDSTINGLGLVNPLDWDEVTDESGVKHNVVKAPGERSEEPYILVDLKEVDGTKIDDGTGDVEFDVKVTGNEINVAWVSYINPTANPDQDPKQAFKNAVRNTVVKQASYDVTKKEGFSPARVLSDPEGGAAVYKPSIINGELTAFVKAHHVSDSQRNSLIERYGNKLISELNIEGQDDDAVNAMIAQRLTTYETMLDYKGDAGTLYLYDFADGGQLSEVMSEHEDGDPIEPVDRLKGLMVTDEGYDYVYLAYSSWNESMEPSSNYDIDNPVGSGKHDAGLYLECVLRDGGEEFAEFDMISYFRQDLKNDAYFDGLELYEDGLYGNTNEKQEESLLIIGQGGKVYTVPFYNNGVGTLESTQFYGGSADGNKTSYSFGEDGMGNLATVYVHDVENTANTGLFLSRYDAREKTWGKGVLLAMRHMDVYEDAVKNGWSDEDTQKAYLGELEGYNRGGMDRFSFDNPQIALGVKADVTEPSGEETKTDDFTHSNTTLVILTQGIMQYLSARTQEDETFITTGATPPADAKFKEGMGIYAISYGVGNQSIGDCNITFMNEDFTAGADLKASLSFVNTGDISIRGSEDNPITVVLNVDGDEVPSTRVAKWEIKENIVPGREVDLSGEFTLPMTLPEGSGFTISISEDASYAEDPYCAMLGDVYTVGSRTELGFEEMDIQLSRQDNGRLTLDDEGNAVIDVDLFVGNRGLKDAGDVKLQFAYGIHDPAVAAQVHELSEAADWNDVIYSALNISGNTLVVGEEEKLYTLQASGDDLVNGILSLGVIHAGCGRHVKGTIKVPADKFTAFGLDGEKDPSGSLRLLTQVFCQSDKVTTDDFGVKQVEYDEYNSGNNTGETTIEHMTAFVVPTRLELPAGVKLRLPVTFSSTLGSTEPDITAFEITDEEDRDNNPYTPIQNMDQTMDIVSFEKGSYKNGAGSGTVVVRGVKEGNGYVRIQDAATNSYQDIAILFTAPGGGIDITNSNGLFTFYDESGKLCKASGKSWVFRKDVKIWGQSGEAPHGGVISSGKPGVSFKFITEAETIELSLDGTAVVACDFPGFSQVEIKGRGEARTVYFGANPDNVPHTVTVTVKKPGMDDEYADFDVLNEHYHGDKTDLTDWETEEPLAMVWNTDFPERGSLNDSQAFEVLIHVIERDDKALNREVSIDRKSSAAADLGMMRTSAGHYDWRVRFKGNGRAELKVSDGAGNNASLGIDIDWWKEESEPTAIKSGSPAVDYYKKKYPGLSIKALSALTDADDVVEHEWMHASWDENAKGIRVNIDAEAPITPMQVYCLNFNDFMSDNWDPDAQTPHLIKRGSDTLIPVNGDGEYIVVAGADKPVGVKDPDYNYRIIREDGSVEEYNADEGYYYNIEYLRIGDEDPTEPETERVPVVGNLKDNILTYDSVSDNDILYLVKGGKYTYEDGLTITPYAKGAVKQNNKTHKLDIKKDSLITFKKGGGEKAVFLRAVKIKKKNYTLNSRDRHLSLADLFTDSGGLLPDVSDGKYLVSIKKDKKGILKGIKIPGVNEGYTSLSEFIIDSTGKKGTAYIQATFGGRTYTAAVRCGGYPVLDTVSGNVVTNFERADSMGNRIITFDSVEDGDVVVLLKNGKYSVESDVSIEPVGAEYKNAVKVMVNKTSGIRKLKISKEAPVKLTKKAGGVTQTKTVIINLVSIKKKSAVLTTAGDSLTLEDIFTGGYEILPDRTGMEAYGGYAVDVVDKYGVLRIETDSFPSQSFDETVTLKDFIIEHNDRKGSATVSVTFGGRVFKTTVKCK